MRFATLAFAVVAGLALAGTLVNQQLLRKGEEERETLDNQLDSLKAQLERLAQALKGKPSISSMDFKRLRDKGLEDPVADIGASLRSERDLIPFEGVMGGTMDFHEVHVLTSRWVLAYFEDGHVGGFMLLEYEVSDEGDISWNLIGAHLD